MAIHVSLPDDERRPPRLHGHLTLEFEEGVLTRCYLLEGRGRGRLLRADEIRQLKASVATMCPLVLQVLLPAVLPEERSLEEVDRRVADAVLENARKLVSDHSAFSAWLAKAVYKDAEEAAYLAWCACLSFIFRGVVE